MENNKINRRIQVLGVLLIIVTLIFGYRLFQKQVLEHNQYVVLASNQNMIKQDTSGARGKIYFSDMFPAATNDQLYQVVAVPHQIKDKAEAASKVASLLGMQESDIYSQINNDKYYIPPLKKHLSEDEAQKVADLKISGFQIVPETDRAYPEGQLASQVLGFTDADGNGHYGIEGYYNDQLKGVGGLVYGQQSANGQIIDLNQQLPPQNGTDIILSINRDIQYEIEQVLPKRVEQYQADSGSVIVADPKTGAILAMANLPTYDPNNFNKVTDQALFNNEAINNAWEPGSVFKPIVMSAAIDAGKVTPDTTNVFGSEVTINGYQIHTSTHQAYGKETMTQVLEHSDNIAMVWVAQQLGKSDMFKYLTNFGFGRKSGIELDTESPGEMADVKHWSDVQQANIAFGQGITATPLQVLMATGAIANSGKMMRPYVVDKTVAASGKENPTSSQVVGQIISAETASKVTQMMISVVDNGQGKHAAVSGYEVAGKTGTAQVPKPGGGYYEDRHVGSFVGFAPATDPKFMMIVRLDNPKNVDWAESSAAPTFGEIASWLLNYYNVPKSR